MFAPDETALLSWPGKSDADGAAHPALCHMLDVAACAAELWPSSPLASLSSAQRGAFLLLVALHDLGKISGAFRRQIESATAPPPNCRHWELTDTLLERFDAILAEKLGGTQTVRRILRQAVAGHHGRPVVAAAERQREAALGPDAISAAQQALWALLALFQPASLSGLDEIEANRLSWLLSGLTTQADWIGSNSEWFPFAMRPGSLSDYWVVAQIRARVAVAKAGLGLGQIARPDPATFVGGALRPMQFAAAQAELPEGPMLAVIEDATGSGKTEAALILAQRMLAAGKGRGIFFALPSMASSDAMFSRMRGQLAHLFAGRPSLALAHGRRLLNSEFADLRGNWSVSPEERHFDDACAPWIADDRRLSLLADIGVGTVDQALMSVLPTRFHTLRMVALANRILIVDEAHDYDPYMETELRALLRFHAMFGGSAIVMTATLPLPMREGYVRAYLQGQGKTRAPALSQAYPALSIIAKTVSNQPVEPFSATRRRVTVKRIGSVEVAVRVIAEGARAGAACLWVRNAVDDAIAAVEALRAEGIAADLLHARFAMADRAGIETEMQARFGKAGQGREGRVLVATQIVQASLDLDFDLMVSDLAPMGDLIQRAGRLWRHERGARPVPGPRLHLLAPDPAEVVNGRWIFATQPSGGWVYPAGVLWRTARALVREGAIDAPEQLRALISEAYGDDPVPEPLERAEAERLGAGNAQAGLARLNVLSAVEGYGQSANYFDDRQFPTRLGQDQVVLVLMRRDGKVLRHWAEGASPAQSEALSEVQLSRRRYGMTTLEREQARPEIAALRAGWPDWAKAVRKIAIVGDDGAIDGGLRYDRLCGLVVLSSDLRG